MWGPHQSPFIFAWINSINSITRNYGIESMLILKHFKKQKSCENCLLERKMTAKFYWKWDSWVILKILRMKDRLLWNDFKKEVIKRGSGHVWRGKLNRLLLPSGVRRRMWDIRRRRNISRTEFRMRDIRRRWDVSRTEFRMWDIWRRWDVGRTEFRMWDIWRRWDVGGQNSGCETSGECGMSVDRIPDVRHLEKVGCRQTEFRMWDIRRGWNVGQNSGCETSGEGGTSAR